MILEAYSIMSHKIWRLILIGDSLVRHPFNPLMILFTNDPERGSLSTNRNDGNHDEMNSCQDVMQFVDGGTTSCYTKILTSIPGEKNVHFVKGSTNLISISKNTITSIKQQIFWQLFVET